MTPEQRKLLAQCRVQSLRGSGPGGQNRNRRDTGVRLYHHPSALRAQSTRYRSRQANLDHALSSLDERLKAKAKVRKSRVPTKRSRQSQEKRLDKKKQRSRLKQKRQKKGIHDDG